MKTQKGLFDFGEPMTHARMMEYLNILGERYPFMGITGLGESVLGRSIPLVTVGEGEKAVLYVGAHNGTEWLTTVLLLRFLNEFGEQYQNTGRIFQYSLPYLLSTRTVYVIPMLNPDGVVYSLEGIDREHILYERVCSMNGGTAELRDWQANARGVDLNRNYAYGFARRKACEAELGVLSGGKNGFSGEMPESEPEIGALCNFLRYNQSIRAVLSLHLGGEKILYTAGNRTAPRSLSLGNAIARKTGYSLAPYEGWEGIGGMGAWCIDECNLPAFSLACGKHEMAMGDWFRIYATLRETLFTMPTMI